VLQHSTEGRTESIWWIETAVCWNVQFEREISCNIAVWREGKNKPTTLLDIETEKLKKEQADLETEFQKVSVAVAVLDIATTTNPLCGETLIDKRPINIAHFYWKYFTLYTKVQKLTLFSVNIFYSLHTFPFPSKSILILSSHTWLPLECQRGEAT